jgi:hypothetical protein
LNVKGSFQIRKNSTWKSNISYRLLLLEDRLLFIKIGGQIAGPGGGTLVGLVLTIAIVVPCFQLYGIMGATLGGMAGGLVGRLAGYYIEKLIKKKTDKKTKTIEYLSLDEVLKSNKGNFQIPYSDIRKVKVTESLPGMNGARSGTMTIETNLRYKFDIVDKQSEAKNLFRALLPHVTLE